MEKKLTKKEKLIEKLTKTKNILEKRKATFDKWQDQISQRIDKGFANLEDFDKGLNYWRKSRRIQDRIWCIEDKITNLKK